MPAYLQNDGNQAITFNYNQDAVSSTFNHLLRELQKPGVYSGGMLSKINDTTVQIAPYTAVVYANNEPSVAIRVHTEQSYSIPISPVAPIVVLRYEWHDQKDNYVQAISKSQTDIDIEDPDGDFYVILGEAVFNGAVLESFDYTKREAVSKDADTIKLGEAVSVYSNPTGGTQSYFPGDTATITDVLLDVYDRLRDLSGVSNDSVKTRHVDKTILSGIAGHNLRVGEDLSHGGIEGGTLSKDLFIQQALQNILNYIKTLSGTDNSMVFRRHLNFGTGSNQISLKDFSMGEGASQPIDGGFTDISHASADKLTATLAKVYSRLNELAVTINAQGGEQGSIGSRVTELESKGTLDNLPIGTILMYDGAGWVDNITLPGWFACTQANYNAGRTPNMEDTFVRGVSPSQRQPTFDANRRGSNTVSIQEQNLPPHQHTASGNIHGNTSNAGSHIHSHSGSNSGNRTINRGLGSGHSCNNGMRSLNSNSSGVHQHAFSANFSVETSMVGSGTPLSLTLLGYDVIFIRKCE